MRLSAALFSVISVVALAASAGASGPSTRDAHSRAAESFREAQAAFERRDFVAAAAAFEEAARYEPHASPWLNAADARERAGDFARAADDCDQVLLISGASDEHRADAERRLAGLLSRVATLTIQGPRTLLLRIDGGPGFHPPMTRRLMPGRHVLAVDDLATRAARVQEVDVEAGGAKTVDLSETAPVAAVVAPPASITPVAAAPASSSTVPAALWVSLGFSGASAVVAGAFSILTVNAREDYLHTPTLATRDGFYRNRLLANLAWGATVIGVASSVVIWRWSSGRSSVALLPTPFGARLVAQVGFEP